MGKAKVFMIMPFQNDFFEVYEMLKERFVNDFEFSHAGDDVVTQQNILKDIVQMIYDADIIIADLTDLNSNVFYELGIAHTLNKKVISITRDLSQLPFDIRSYRATEYSTHFKKFDSLLKELQRYLSGAVDGSVSFGNPVSDFLSTVDESNIGQLYSKHTTADDERGEAGFLDFMAEIEEKMNLITETLTAMTNDLDIMTQGVEESTTKIEQVSGSGSASFFRKEARKVANHISTFSSQLKAHNRVYLATWPEIENNCLSLLESKHVKTEENIGSLKDFLKGLYRMKIAAIAASDQTREMKNTFLNTKGFQKALNQAINTLEIDINQYLEFTSQMDASIDRILDKSKFVVGEIDFLVVEEGEADE